MEGASTSATNLTDTVTVWQRTMTKKSQKLGSSPLQAVDHSLNGKEISITFLTQHSICEDLNIEDSMEANNRYFVGHGNKLVSFRFGERCKQTMKASTLDYE